MNKPRLILLYYLPPLIWAGLIFYLSSLPDLKSDLPNLLDLIIRKIAHMLEFGILVILLLRMFLIKEGKPIDLKKSLITEKTLLKEVFAAALILSLLYSFTDEFHQTFVFGRNGSIWDVLIDAIGIVAGIYFFVRWRLSRDNPNKKSI